MGEITLNRCPRFGVLTEDIYYNIVEGLSTVSRKHLLSTSLVSHTFHTLSTIFLFRTIKLGRWGRGELDKALLRRLAGHTSLCSYVRELILNGETSEESVQALLSILPHMIHLKDFRMRTAVAFTLIQAITRTNPSVRLDIYLEGFGIPHQLLPSEYKEIFGASPNLVSIDARTDCTGLRGFLNDIQHLASSSTNLSSLILHVHYGGFVISQRTIGDVTFQNGQRLSSLRRLWVDGTIPDESWGQSIPWDTLEDVYFSTFPDILHTVVEEMKSLRSVKLRGKYWYPNEDRLGLTNSINNFLLRLPSALEELDLEELTADIPVSTIIRFRASLKRLRLHILEKYDIPGTRQVLSMQQLEELCAACTRLEELQIDINRNGEWPYDILDAAASFPQLKKLTLSLELGVQAEEFLKPYATHYSSVEMYKYIKSRRQSLSLLPLIELTVELGGYREVGPGHPADWMLWEMDNQVAYKIASAERLEDAKAGLLEVWIHGAIRGHYGPVGGDTVDDKRIAALHGHGSPWGDLSSEDEF